MTLKRSPLDKTRDIDYSRVSFSIFYNFMLKAFFTVLLLTFSAHSLILENLSKTDLKNKFKDKKIGFYIGSFDPIHKGHEAFIKKVLTEKLCDYVFIYPAWGGDKYKKRTDVKVRLQMLQTLYEKSDSVLITHLPPYEMQEKMQETGATFIGMLGSDMANAFIKNEKAATMLMRGKPVDPGSPKLTLSGLNALKAEEFIVGMRAGDQINKGATISGRKLTHFLNIDGQQETSSTKVRGKIKEGQSISSMISSKVEALINALNLYQ